jgi:hypothetical protein
MTFTNDGGITAACTRSDVAIHNQSDTAVLYVSVVFRPSWFVDFSDGSTRSEDEALTSPMKQPAGVPAFDTRDLIYSVCPPPPSISTANANAVIPGTIPVSLTWDWRQ